MDSDCSLKDELRKEIEDKFNSFRKMFIEGMVARATTRTSQTPFIFKIQRFNMLVLRMFDGKTDPRNMFFIILRR